MKMRAIFSDATVSTSTYSGSNDHDIAKKVKRDNHHKRKLTFVLCAHDDEPAINQAVEIARRLSKR